jgi:hypothetical protein
MSREEILLKEYETCQAENDGSARNFWTTFGFFVSFSTAVIGGIIALAVAKHAVNEIHPVWLGLLLIFCILVLAVLFFLRSWLKRVDHFIGVNISRMCEIERELGMETKQLIRALDTWKPLGNENEIKEQYRELRKGIIDGFTSLSEEQKQKIADREYQLPKHYKPPKSAKRLFFCKLFCPLISIWVILALLITGLLLHQLIC